MERIVLAHSIGGKRPYENGVGREHGPRGDDNEPRPGKASGRVADRRRVHAFRDVTRERYLVNADA